MPVPFTKAQAYGNDFLLVNELRFGGSDPAGFARRVCNRHHGVGADGLVLYRMHPGGAGMRLFNADGSASELSGNGLRCLGAILARAQEADIGAHVQIHTGAGVKDLELREHDGQRFTFCAAMGSPENLERVTIEAAGEQVNATLLRTGNPQCVVLGPLPDGARFARLGRALSTHEMFPAETNVEFVHVETPTRIRILIWERGVGPTTSSGTGSCASAVAAAAFGGAARDLEVVAPGGTQRVEWRPDGIYLTGWAEIVCDGVWLL
jgi:diaminopimelate epimerase